MTTDSTARRAALPSAQTLAEFDAVFSSPEVARGLQATSASGYAVVSRFWKTAHTAPALTPRMRELVLLVLAATASTLDSVGVRRHVGRALAAGASQRDVLDVLITIVPGANHALYFALPVLMRELKAMEHPQAELPPMTPQAEAIKAEFIRKRGFWNELRDLIARLMPEYFDALSELATESWTNGTLLEKERELMCIAIDCTVTHMFEPGLAMHIRHALQKGATREEILEVFNLASLTGLNGVILGAEAMFGKPPAD